MSRVRYAVLGEDETDKATIHAILRTLTGDVKLPRNGRGFGGSGDLLNEGARVLKGLVKTCDRFIICLDADGNDPDAIRSKILERIVKPSGMASACCVTVPVQEIEAWILADIDQAISRWKKHPSWRPIEVHNPEGLRNPKEALIRMSRQGGARPRYDPVVDNEQIAAHLDLKRVEKKCPSFGLLREFVSP